MRIFLLISARAGEALSANSFSAIIAVKIALSRNLFGCKALKNVSSTLDTPEFVLLHWVSERITLKTSPMSRSSLILSTLPAAALARELFTFFIPPKDGPPNLARSMCASTV